VATLWDAHRPDAITSQLWGPRYAVYVVAAPDLALFSLARLPDAGELRRRAENLADRLNAFADSDSGLYPAQR
jgi:hypothetical protein